MENTIQFIQVTPEQLEERIVQGVKNILKGVIQPEQEELLTRDEAAKFLNVSFPTLHSWTSAGKIASYGLGNKVFYKKSEIMASLTPLKK